MKNLSKILPIVMALMLIFCTGALAQSENITNNCQFWVSEGSASDVTDGSIKTGWKPANPDAELRIALPENAGYVGVDWQDDPTGYVFIQYNANKEIISETDIQDSFVGMSQLFRVDENARYAALRLTNTNQSVQKIRVYSRGELPLKVRDFKPAHDKCDLMVISAHQDDEWIFYGGIIPYYEYVQEKKVQVVYMANCGPTRKEEALNGLWAGGVRNHPEFLDLKDENVQSLNEALEHWGGKEGLTGVLVDCIRRYQPEVILTHDIDGEYGHNQHKLTSRAMETAIIAAADPNQYPESYEKYGAWQVKKLYLHLADNAIDFDWNVKYDQLRGYTPLEVAKIAYSKHETQQKYYQVEDGGKYDNSLFGLTYSVVGDDVLRNDLFENITPAVQATPEPAATPEPTAEPVVQQVAETPQPTAEPMPAAEERGGSGLLIGLAIGAVVLAAAGAGAYLYIQNQRRRRRRRRKRYVRR